jgi:hypothetical protein
VAKFKHLEKATNQNYIDEIIKSRLNSVNACYIYVQSLLCSSLLSNRLKIEVHMKLGLTLSKEHRLRVFRNSVVRRIFGPKRRK